jgi:hypothetical protein
LEVGEVMVIAEARAERERVANYITLRGQQINMIGRLRKDRERREGKTDESSGESHGGQKELFSL